MFNVTFWAYFLGFDHLFLSSHLDKAHQKLELQRQVVYSRIAGLVFLEKQRYKMLKSRCQVFNNGRKMCILLVAALFIIISEFSPSKNILFFSPLLCIQIWPCTFKIEFLTNSQTLHSCLISNSIFIWPCMELKHRVLKQRTTNAPLNKTSIFVNWFGFKGKNAFLSTSHEMGVPHDNSCWVHFVEMFFPIKLKYVYEN